MQQTFEFPVYYVEVSDVDFIDESIMGADVHGDDYSSMRHWQVDREIANEF